MPDIQIDEEEMGRWQDELAEQYENDVRTGVHLSDLQLCLRQSPLSKLYAPKWDLVTLFRFRMGNALEKAFFKSLLPVATEEMELVQDGVEGHIDFGTDPLDYECKLTWSKKKEPEVLLDEKFWWFERMGWYTHMRHRVEMRLTVLFLFPIPDLVCYRVGWDEDELLDSWEIMLERKAYVEERAAMKELPDKTHLTWLCRGCPVKQPCDTLAARGE